MTAGTRLSCDLMTINIGLLPVRITIRVRHLRIVSRIPPVPYDTSRMGIRVYAYIRLPESRALPRSNIPDIRVIYGAATVFEPPCAQWKVLGFKLMCRWRNKWW